MSTQLPLETGTELIFKGSGSFQFAKAVFTFPRNALPNVVQYKFSLVYRNRNYNTQLTNYFVSEGKPCCN